MRIFPDINTAQGQRSSSEPVKYGSELDFNFSKGDFVMQDGAPRVVEGVDALRVWIEKTLHTARYRYPIYSFAYGCELEDIIGCDISGKVLEAEIIRVIREALVCDDRIDDVRDFKIERGGDRLKAEFVVITFDGQNLRQEVMYSV